jgi:hypothetical protein
VGVKQLGFGRRRVLVGAALAAVVVASAASALAGCSLAGGSNGQPAASQSATQSTGATATRDASASVAATTPPPPTPLEAATAQAAAAKRDADAFAQAVQLPMWSDVSFGTEPQTDVWPQHQPVRLYVHISKVTTSPATVTYDAHQVFTGGAAKREAARDKQPAPASGLYERNAYPFSQTLNVADSAGVILNLPREGDVQYGFASYPQVTATSLADFAVRFSAGPESDMLKWQGYWIVFDGEGVHSIVQQPHK